MVNLWIPKSSLPNSFYYTLNCLDSILANKKEMFFRKYRDGEDVDVGGFTIEDLDTLNFLIKICDNEHSIIDKHIWDNIVKLVNTLNPIIEDCSYG